MEGEGREGKERGEGRRKLVRMLHDWHSFQHLRLSHSAGSPSRHADRMMELPNHLLCIIVEPTPPPSFKLTSLPRSLKVLTFVRVPKVVPQKPFRPKLKFDVLVKNERVEQLKEASVVN